MPKFDLSIIILSYNTKDLLRNCLVSLEKAMTKDLAGETIVVDNASVDGSVEMIKKEFPEVKLIASKKNLGFTKGNNLGMKKAQGKYLLLLNSDTEVFSDTLIKMVGFMEKNPRVGLATCRVEFLNGQLDPACHRGFPTPWAALTYFVGLEKLLPRLKIFSQYHQLYKNLNSVHEIDSPSGAFSLVRQKVAREVGFLDEDYFMYGEDLDWAYRIKKSGWQVVFNPQSKIIHYKKQSGRAKAGNNQKARLIRRSTTNYFYQTMKIFYHKHYRQRYPKLVTGLVILGIELKRIISQLKN